MKLLIFFLGVLLAGKNLQAQERAQVFLSNNNDTLIRKGFQSMIAVPGNQVSILPQDGMPCIVPNTSNIAAMPNALPTLKQPIAGKIPNAWKKREPKEDVFVK